MANAMKESSVYVGWMRAMLANRKGGGDPGPHDKLGMMMMRNQP